jgi:hypothetical protein
MGDADVMMKRMEPRAVRGVRNGCMFAESVGIADDMVDRYSEVVWWCRSVVRKRSETRGRLYRHKYLHKRAIPSEAHCLLQAAGRHHGSFQPARHRLPPVTSQP